AGQFSLEALARDGVPEASGFVILQDGDPVDAADHGKVVHRAPDDRAQTDAAAAPGTEGDEVGFTTQLALGYVMVGHVERQQTAPLPHTLEGEQLAVGREPRLP